MIGLQESSGLLRCSQSANRILHPLKCTSSTSVLSFVETRNVVTPGTPSVSVVCRGLAVPGPARSEAKLVAEVKGGPGGGAEDVRAW